MDNSWVIKTRSRCCREPGKRETRLGLELTQDSLPVFSLFNLALFFHKMFQERERESREEREKARQKQTKNKEVVKQWQKGTQKN